MVQACQRPLKGRDVPLPSAMALTVSEYRGWVSIEDLRTGRDRPDRCPVALPTRGGQRHATCGAIRERSGVQHASSCY
jgi:hypothetical protein